MPVIYIFKNNKPVSSVHSDIYADYVFYCDRRKKKHQLPVHMVFTTFPNAVIRVILVASRELPDSKTVAVAVAHFNSIQRSSGNIKTQRILKKNT